MEKQLGRISTTVQRDSQSTLNGVACSMLAGKYSVTAVSCQCKRICDVQELAATNPDHRDSWIQIASGRQLCGPHLTS